MKIYANEIKDGLQEVIKTNDSFAVFSIACVEELIDKNTDLLKSLTEKDNLSIANLNTDDLFYLKSILVSCGWNLNSDIFMPDELWKAVATPHNKPFNFMHNEKDIIGHITGSYVIDDDGNKLGPDMPVGNFHIVTNAVVYKDWSDQDQKGRINKIIAEIVDTDNWFVSMECKFSNFDYALKNDNNEVTIINRSEASAYLTKYLRSYGGSGKYEDYTIGRVLKNISFIGKGLVNKPANPNSIIIKNEKIILKAGMEKEMPYTQEDFDKLNSELSVAKANETKLDTEINSKTTEINVAAAKLTEIENAVALKDAEIVSLKDANATLTVEIQETKATLEEVSKAKSYSEDKLKEMEDKEKMMKRKASLVDAGILAENIEETVASFIELADEAFNRVVAAMKKNMFGKKDEDKVKPEDKAKPDDKAKAEQATKELEEIKEEKSKAGLNEIPTVEPKDLRSEASAWFEQNLPFSKTTKK